MTALITIVFAIGSVVGGLHVARRDDRRRQDSIDDVLVRRYRKPITTRSWS